MKSSFDKDLVKRLNIAANSPTLIEARPGEKGLEHYLGLARNFVGRLNGKDISYHEGPGYNFVEQGIHKAARVLHHSLEHLGARSVGRRQIPEEGHYRNEQKATIEKSANRAQDTLKSLYANEIYGRRVRALEQFPGVLRLALRDVRVADFENEVLRDRQNGDGGLNETSLDVYLAETSDLVAESSMEREALVMAASRLDFVLDLREARREKEFYALVKRARRNLVQQIISGDSVKNYRDHMGQAIGYLEELRNP